MRLYTEYVFMFSFAFLLFVAYLIITVRSDNVDYDLNGTKIPNISENNVYQLYTTSNCASGSYQSFKSSNGIFTSSKKIIISSLTIPSNNSAKGLIKIGYGDNGINCQVAAPTNEVILYENSTPISSNINEYKTFIKIPIGKVPYLQITGFNYEAAAIGVEY